MSSNVTHIPVALEECIKLLAPAITNKKNPVLIDATLGLGGHAKVFLERFENLKLIGIDRDQGALEIAKSNLAQYLDRVCFIHNTYDQIQLALSEADTSAAIILNTYSHGQLAKLLQNYGEEKFASKIAENIIKARDKNALNTTKDLAEIVKDSIPAPARRTGGNPAKRTFQALRIEVNQELAILERAIPAALSALTIGGRLVVMSYQSLEDRIVKNHFTQVSKSKTPLQLPVELPDSAASYKLLISGSQGADEDEQGINPRSQSMRLRAIERVAA